MLQRLGCSVDVVSDGESAVMQSSSQPYDLIFMDCQMPVKDGYDAVRSIREREKQAGTIRIPVIALTASALTGDREACLAAGMDDYIAKPFRLEQLHEALKTWTRLKSS